VEVSPARVGDHRPEGQFHLIGVVIAPGKVVPELSQKDAWFHIVDRGKIGLVPRLRSIVNALFHGTHSFASYPERDSNKEEWPLAENKLVKESWRVTARRQCHSHQNVGHLNQRLSGTDRPLASVAGCARVSSIARIQQQPGSPLNGVHGRLTPAGIGPQLDELQAEAVQSVVGIQAVRKQLSGHFINAIFHSSPR